MTAAPGSVDAAASIVPKRTNVMQRLFRCADALHTRLRSQQKVQLPAPGLRNMCELQCVESYPWELPTITVCIVCDKIMDPRFVFVTTTPSDLVVTHRCGG